MRIAVCGDTHGHIARLREELAKLKDIDYIIHTGDYYRDGIELARTLGVKYRVVVGNCDIGMKGPQEEIFTLAGYRFLLSHGHRYKVKNHLISLKLRAQEVKADVVIFGHTHTSYYEMVGNTLFLNPGSASYPRMSQSSTYAVLEGGEQGLGARIFRIEEHEEWWY